MKYEVRCECEKVRAVSAADAGVSLPCPCGRTVDVPPLHILRASAGEQAISPALQIQGMLLRNELPGTRACACCHRDTDHVLRVSVVCERVSTRTRSRANPHAVLGCLVFGLFGWIALRSAEETIERGREVSFTLPVRLCEVCNHETPTPSALRAALCATPVYAALLDQYPNAAVARVG